jgi:hypothetical protein
MTAFTANRTFTADANRTFGIEIEIEFKSARPAFEIAQALTDAGIRTEAQIYNHHTCRVWKIVSDASVHGGWELVSPPLAFTAESFAQIETVSRVLTDLGAKIDRECGLHVHHYAGDLTARQVGKVVALYAKHETWIDAMMPVSRRAQNNRFTKSLNVLGNLADTVTAFAACKTRVELETLLTDRYFKVNVHSLYRHNTLEFRHHSGTIEAAKIINWVQITRALLEKGMAAKTVTVRNDSPNVDRFFRLTCGKELAAYIRQRTAALA